MCVCILKGCVLNHSELFPVCVCVCVCVFWYRLCIEMQLTVCLSSGRGCELRHHEPYVFLWI